MVGVELWAKNLPADELVNAQRRQFWQQGANVMTKNREQPGGLIKAEIRPLSLEAPYGLFEDIHGAWYLIASDPEFKLAIVLAHHELPSFTCLRLKTAPLTCGYSWGKFRVSAGPSVDDFGSIEPGLMSGMSWPTLSLQCHSHLTATQWIDLGRVTKAREAPDNTGGEPGSDFPSWTIIRAKDRRPIVTRSEDGSVRLGGDAQARRDYVTHMKVKPGRR